MEQDKQWYLDIREWFQTYKVYEGHNRNEYVGGDQAYMTKEETLEFIKECNGHFKKRIAKDLH